MFQFCWSLARAQRSRAQHVGDDGPSVLLQLGGVPAPVPLTGHRRSVPESIGSSYREASAGVTSVAAYPPSTRTFSSSCTADGT